MYIYVYMCMRIEIIVYFCSTKMMTLMCFSCVFGPIRYISEIQKKSCLVGYKGQNR